MISMVQPDTQAAAARDGAAAGAGLRRPPGASFVCGLGKASASPFPDPPGCAPTPSPEGSVSSTSPGKAAGAPRWGGRGGGSFPGPFASGGDGTAGPRASGAAASAESGRTGPDRPAGARRAGRTGCWRRLHPSLPPSLRSPPRTPFRRGLPEAGGAAVPQGGRRGQVRVPPRFLRRVGEEGGWGAGVCVLGGGGSVCLLCLPPPQPPVSLLSSRPPPFPSPPHLLQACGTVAV